MIVLALDQGALTGAVNGTAPTPVRFADFATALGEALGRPSWLPVPGFALRAVMGQMAEAALTGQRAVPRKALAAGYVFRYAGLREALRAVVGRGARER
jgi:NAD dependent epimerase/dehydratase family enzyme